jgi:hypothetical protein
MNYEPAYSPWGEVQTCQLLCPGVFQVSTASHGGVMAVKNVATRIFSEMAQKYGFWERGYLCFEEDACATVALRELMDRGLYTAPVNEYFGPGEYSACIDSSIQTFYPDYWVARENGMTQAPGQMRLELER